MGLILFENMNNKKFTRFGKFFLVLKFFLFSSVKKHWTELLMNWTENWTGGPVQFSSFQSEPEFQFSSVQSWKTRFRDNTNGYSSKGNIGNGRSDAFGVPDLIIFLETGSEVKKTLTLGALHPSLNHVLGDGYSSKGKSFNVVKA